MSKKPYLIVALLLVAAVAFSLILMPRNQEIALMQMKDKRFEEALVSYEKQKAKGKLTVDVVSHLSELYLQKGAVDKAIEIMESFISEHPNHLEARKRLGTYYQYAQRNDDYLRNLEEINRLTPTPENLKTLSDIYNFNADYSKQSETLKTLIATEKGEDAKHFIDRANIQAAEKDYPGAIETLAEMKAKHPDKFGYEETALLVSLLLDQRRPDEALKAATDWQAANPTDFEHAAKLVNMLHYKGNAELAGKLVAAYSEEQVNSSPALMQEFILLEIAGGHEDRVYDRLKQMEETGTLSAELKERLLYLALVRNDRDVAKKVMGEIDFKTLNEPQLAALVELGATSGDDELLQRLRHDFPEAEAAETYPVLTAMLAMALNERQAESRINALSKLELSTPTNLQVARSCARTNHPACARTFLKKLPPVAELSDSELASAVSVNLELKAWKDAQAMLDQAEGRDSPQLTESRLRIAAVQGKNDIVEAWLEKEGATASPRLLADLFFLSYNNNQLALATVIAEKFHAREDTSLSRSVLAQVYVKTGQYKEALALLKDNTTRTADDEANYLFALAKLAPSDPQYRKELSDYAAARLRSDLPQKQKMALVYALVTAKQIEPAMPYIRELAMKEGGYWASLYAETLDKQGRHDEARQFWLALASQPSTSAKDRRAIAYTLLGNGYRADAENIFTHLAKDAPAGSTDVKQLGYLWGPRPSPEKIDWMADRMQRADTKEQAQWADMIADTVTDEQMIDLAMRSPVNVRQKVLADRYVEALSHQDNLPEQYNAIMELARDQGRVDLLRLYARAARDSGNMREARAAYDALFAMDASDVEALRESGIVAYNQADYTGSKLYLSAYNRAAPEMRAADNKAHDAYFVYAEDLRHDRNEKATEYYQMALERMNTAGKQDAETLSRQAQAMIWTGHEKEGLIAFRNAIARYPNDDILRADYAAMLIELKRYKAARQVLATPPSLAPAAGETEYTSLPTTVAHYQLNRHDTELVLAINKESDVQAVSRTLRSMPGVAYTSEGYDSLLVGAAAGSKFEVDANQPTLQVRTTTDNESFNAQAGRQIQLRYELLAARIELETGEVHAANQRIDNLLPAYQNDAQLLGFAANAQNYGGNWPHAQALLARAHKIAPENEDIIALDKDMRRINAPGVKIDGEWIKRGNDHEFITTLSGYTYVDENVQLGLTFQNNRVLAKNDRLADGRIGNFSEHKQRGELYGLYSWENGNYLKASLYGNNDTLGVGGDFHFLNPFGETLVELDWHRPFWEFTESVLDDTTRDQIFITHMIKPMPELFISGGPGYVRYNVEDTSKVFEATALRAAITYRLLEEREDQPFLAIGYGFDAEYEISQKKNIDALGGYTPMTPLRTREVHFVSLTGGYEFTETTYGDAVLGYGWDRFGNSGPSIEARLNHEFTQSIDGQLRGSYGFDNGRGNNSVTRAGGYLRWKY